MTRFSRIVLSRPQVTIQFDRSSNPTTSETSGAALNVHEGRATAGPSTLVRQRLLSQLEGVESHGLAVVVAPVGSGKTTLLEQWSAARPGAVRWCSHADLSDPDALLRDLGGPGAAGGVVIDNVADKETLRADDRLVRVIEQLAPVLPVVLAARRMPAFNLARHEFPQPVVVTARDLSFRTWEIADLFAHVYRDPLAVEDPLTIAERTDGWAAALRLWQLARRLRDRGEQEDPDAEPGAFDGLLGCYLGREVLSSLGPGSRRLLARSAAFDCVTAQRLDLLLGRRDCHHALTRIERKVALVGRAASSPEGLSYRHHVALRRHLRSELVRELGVVGARRLYLRAARVAEEVGDIGEAGAALCRAQDAAALAALINRHGPSAATTSPGLIDVVTPALARQHPVAARVRADLLRADGRTHEARRESASGPTVAADGVAGSDAVGAECAGLPVSALSASVGAEALRMLLVGGPGPAAESLAGAGSGADPGRLVAELALAALDALVDPRDGLAGLERVDDDILMLGSRWLRRLCHAAALASTGDPHRCAEVLRLAAARERLGDHWGTCLIESAVALASLRHGRPDPDLLERLCERYRRLGAPVLEAWARSSLALARTQGDFPDSDVVASALACARTAGAPGPLAVAYAALAESSPDRRAEMLALAQSTARAAGLTCRPWTWTRDAAARSTPHRLAGTVAAARERGRATAVAARPAVRGPARATTAPATRAIPTRRHPGELAITCFGTFAVTGAEGTRSLTGVRPVALTVLRMLAVQAGVPVHRDAFVEAQWPGLSEQSAHHNLHVSVSNLRHGLEALVPGRSRELLARQGRAYVLAPGEETVTDLQRFDGRLAEATRCRRAGERTGQAEALRAALALYVGEVLPGDGTAEWVVPVRELYRLRAAGAAAQLAALELSRERTAAAVAAAQRSVQIDPWRDSSWQTLIAAHVQAGEPAEAERAAQEYAAVLASLGIRTMPVRQAPVASPASGRQGPQVGRSLRVRTA